MTGISVDPALFAAGQTVSIIIIIIIIITTNAVHTNPTLLFSTTVNLPYCETCEMYQNVITLPDTAPIGNYRIGLIATRPGYEADSAMGSFFVTPPLSLTLTTSQDVLNMEDTLTLTARVSE